MFATWECFPKCLEDVPRKALCLQIFGWSFWLIGQALGQATGFNGSVLTSFRFDIECFHFGISSLSLKSSLSNSTKPDMDPCCYILHAGRGDDQCSILSDSPFLNLDRWLSFAHLPHWQPRWILEARCWVTRLKMGVLPEVFLLERFYCTHFIKKMDSRLSHGPCGPLFGLVCLR